MDKFALQFTTNDLQLNARDNGVSVTCSIDEKQFEDIVYRYGIAVLEIMERRGLIKGGRPVTVSPT